MTCHMTLVGHVVLSHAMELFTTSGSTSWRMNITVLTLSELSDLIFNIVAIYGFFGDGTSFCPIKMRINTTNTLL